MLEFIFSAERIKKNPIYAFFSGAMITLISFVISLLVFPSAAGLMTVFFVTMTIVPFATNVFIKNEFLEKQKNKPGFFERHEFILKTYTLFFLAVVFGLSFLFHVMPAGEAERAFSSQMQAMDKINFRSTNPGDFYIILSNNLKVSVISFLLSILFGAGALLVLSWNASIIAVFIGGISKGFMPVYSSLGAAAVPISYVHGLPIAILSIFLHGIPEITSYFLSGLAGGLISVALIREKVWSPEFNRVAKDGLMLLVASLALVVVAAFLESPPL